jgi:cytochrome c-type biogenesis protein CcmF
MVSLAAITFLLTIFGTFLTRTGVAVSVHAFTEPRLIAWFAVFMVLMLLLPVGLLVKRYATLRSSGEPSGLFSDDSNILYTVVLLSIITFLILWGVIYPPIAHSLTNREFVFGTGFFDSVTAPLGLVLLLLLVVCALASSLRGSRRRLVFGGLGVAAAGLVVLVVLLSAGVRKGYPVAAFVLCGAAIAATALMFARGWRNRRRYGALLVHLGLLILMIGLAGSWAYKQSVEGQLALGESLTLGELKIDYQDVQLQAENNTDRSVTRATVGLSIDGKNEGQLSPSLEYYPASDQTWTRVARRTSLAGDVYVSLLSVDSGSKTADFRLEYHPLIIWLWIGGGVMSLGALVALWSLRRRRRPAGAAPGGALRTAASGTPPREG